MNRDPAPHHPLVQRLIDARQVTDALFSIVKPEFLYDRPIRERHRIVFYIGHLEAFDRNLFDQRLCELPAFDPHLDQLFAFGIDPSTAAFRPINPVTGHRSTPCAATGCAPANRSIVNSMR